MHRAWTSIFVLTINFPNRLKNFCLDTERTKDKRKTRKSVNSFLYSLLFQFNHCNTVANLSLDFYEREYELHLHNVPFDFMTLRRPLTILSSTWACLQDVLWRNVQIPIQMNKLFILHLVLHLVAECNHVVNTIWEADIKIYGSTQRWIIISI